MPTLTIRLKKKADGSAALTCIRPDGSSTWQRQEGRLGAFFPYHDLTHFAVETVLRHEKGFYGMVAGGWDLTDFGAPWPKGPMPKDLDPSELIVGFLDLERAGGVRWSAADLNDKLRDRAGAGVASISEDDLGRIRALMNELFERWAAVPTGEALELEYG